MTAFQRVGIHFPSEIQARQKPRIKGEIKVRLIKMFSLAAVAAVVAMAFIGATSASALKSTQLCKVHTSLVCDADNAQTHVHAALKAGTVGTLTAPLFPTVLCLNVLFEATPLGLDKPQNVHTLKLEFTGCGTNAEHNNCTVTVQELPLGNVLKTGLDEGVLTNTSGRTRLQCPSTGTDCVYDLEGSEFALGAQHLTAEETPTIELGEKFFCPNEGKLNGLLVSLLSTYILQ